MMVSTKGRYALRIMIDLAQHSGGSYISLSDISKQVNYEMRYKDSYNRVRKFIPAIAKILKGHCREYKLIHKSMRSGVLDTTKLA